MDRIAPASVIAKEVPGKDAAERFYARVEGSAVGLVDASGSTAHEAKQRAWDRYQRRLMGVDMPPPRPTEAVDPMAGEIASDGCRWALWRTIGPGPIAMWVMLNPSTADANHDDATMRRVLGFSSRAGYGRITVGNCYPFRSKDPAELKTWLKSPQIGRMYINDSWLISMATAADAIVLGWGSQVGQERSAKMKKLLYRWRRKVYHLAETKTGEPAHPLRLRQTLDFTPWRF